VYRSNSIFSTKNVIILVYFANHSGRVIYK